MQERLQSFRRELPARVCHFLWRQWGQLGVASASVEPRDGWIIDPEALLLLSCTYARYDARLFDEIMDWLLINASCINTSRLRSAQRRFEFAGGKVMNAMMAKLASEDRRLHWRTDAEQTGVEAVSLFLSAEGIAQPDFGPCDEGFLHAGFRRGRMEFRQLSRRFNPVMPECALLRLRALFGAVARADIMAYLLTHETAHPSGIARDTGFSQKNIQDTLVDMAASGIVHTAKLEGRMKHYFADKRPASALLHDSRNGSHVPEWVTWLPVFRILEMLLLALRDIEDVHAGDGITASKLRDLKAALAPLIQHSGHSAMFSDETRHTGTSYIGVFLDDIERWVHAVLHESPSSH